MNHIKIEKWEDDLIWCPSQCYGIFYLYDHHCELYLRWRHDDPWQGHLIVGSLRSDIKKNSPEYWSEDLFDKYGEYFKDYELNKAKKKIIKLAEKEICEIENVPIEDLPTLINDKNELVRVLSTIRLKNNIR